MSEYKPVNSKINISMSVYGDPYNHDNISVSSCHGLLIEFISYMLLQFLLSIGNQLKGGGHWLN